ncbi:serine hydrolase domain-containing protein [Tenacibaculum ovolyticum]|uniref:serine hydrolase domain-containing protein n=1 Tax=Tenacibaculum ovolyticum TaxID=104270 RepID=UPI001F189D53|nr:serine hydrolase domain-containing protein [Tenacibaculum ovolyticum]
MNTLKRYNYQKQSIKTLKIKVYLLLIAIFFISCTEDPIPISSTLKKDIVNQEYVKIIEEKLSNLPLNSQVAIAIINNESTEYIGVINDKNTLKVTSNSDNIFEIGSITKIFTSICLSKLITTNEATLTETLSSQFDFSIPTGGNITLLQLANHTSGLPVVPTNIGEIKGYNASDPYATYTLDNLKNYLQNDLVLSSESGFEYLYSNLGTGMLGYILAQKRQKTYEELLHNIIFKPLNMDNSTTLLANVDPKKLVEGRDKDGNIVPYWNFDEVASGAGSIKSSVKDLEKFVRKNFENDIVYNLPQKKTFDKGNNTCIGLGWGIIEDENFTVLTHNGGTGGFTSILMLDKRLKTGIIVLSNVDKYIQEASQLCNSLFLNKAN